MREHVHPLDNKLHAGCVECHLIESRRERAALEAETDKAADRYAKVAAKAPPGDLRPEVEL